MNKAISKSIKKASFLFFLSFFHQSIYSQCFEFTYQYGGAETFEMGRGIATSGDDIIITGMFGGTAEIGDSMVTAVGLDGFGPNDLFLAKLANDGSLIWISHTGGQQIPNVQTGPNNGRATTVDGLGNVIFTATYIGNPMLESESLPVGGPNEDMLIAKYNASGALLWVRTGIGTYNVTGLGITTDESENIYATGIFGHHNFAGSVNFDGTVLNSVGGRDIFFSKYDSDGTLQWAKRAGSSQNVNETGYDISVNPDGNIFAIGMFVGTADFDSENLVSSGGRDIFLAKLDPTGNYIWVEKEGGLGNDEGRGIAPDTFGNFFVTGHFEGNAIIGDTTLVSDGGKDIFIAKYDDACNLIWARKSGGNGEDAGISIAVGENGNAYVTGYFNETAVFGSTTLTSAGGQDIFTACYDADGNVIWAVRAGGMAIEDNSDVGLDIALDDFGQIWLTGHFEEEADFSCANLESFGGKDIFLSKIGICPPEICDDLDNDCDGLLDDEDSDITGQLNWYLDYDGDGFGTSEFFIRSCIQPFEYVENSLDCDDLDPNSPIIGDLCDDGKSMTVGDSVNQDCICAGRESIPTLSFWALLILGLLLIIIGSITIDLSKQNIQLQ